MPMKIGVVSDIHAYLEPLKKAISIFESQDVDHIICAGDLVDGGWDDDAVIDYIRAYSIESVQGNHDRQAFSEQVDMWFEDDLDESFNNPAEICRARYVTLLPKSHEFIWEGLCVYVAHGAP